MVFPSLTVFFFRFRLSLHFVLCHVSHVVIFLQALDRHANLSFHRGLCGYFVFTFGEPMINIQPCQKKRRPRHGTSWTGMKVWFVCFFVGSHSIRVWCGPQII
jgi:hypothetical protein